jgi:F-type H+/Na+-transporting ATPase subunit alpha
MAKDINQLIKKLEQEVKNIEAKIELKTEGQIETINDGIATISGLPEAMYNELLQFPYNIKGLAFNLEENQIGVVILGDYEKLKEGDKVSRTGNILEIPASEEFLGRVIDPLGNPLDGKSKPSYKTTVPLEKIAPGVIERQSVDTPLQTGIKAIDSMIPIGRGQRELIIGDRSTGKSAIAIDTIINQKQGDVYCIYVSVGQKRARIPRIVEKLKQTNSLDYTIIVSANASDPASMQYIAPYAGCAIAEYFMSKGKDVLIVYDDLSKHAWGYRQLSLLLKRPSGREAYPGDIFYLHSRLLERACKLSPKFGGGSITALPIIETQAGDLSAYIPTNVISITDGQIYLEPDLFFAGIRPAVNVGLSVSRVGGAAQVKGMKKVAGQLRLDLAQFRELAAFTQFTTDLDVETKQKIDRGSRISEIFKQSQYQPMPVEQQIVIIWAATQGYLDQIPIELIKKFEEEFLNSILTRQNKILKDIAKDKQIKEHVEKKLITYLKKFINGFKNKNNIGKTEAEEV